MFLFSRCQVPSARLSPHRQRNSAYGAKVRPSGYVLNPVVGQGDAKVFAINMIPISQQSSASAADGTISLVEGHP